MNRDHLVVFGPLPPSRSGIADYLSEQLPSLQSYVDVTVVVDDSQRLDEARGRHPGLDIRPWSDWNLRPDRDALFLHHVGNNPFHAFVRESVLRYPGVVALHDFVQHHLVVALTIGRGETDAYEALMTSELGAIGGILAKDRAAGVFSELDHFLLPLNRQIIEAARGVTVHSASSFRAVQEMGTGVKLARIPHHFVTPPGGRIGRERARRELGIAEEQLVVVALGHITPPKQVQLVLQALSELRPHLPAPVHLYLVGEPHDRAYWDHEIGRRGLENAVTCTGYTSLERLFHYAEAADVVVNLRYPSAGETSGTLLRALGVGATCLVFDFGPFADFPDDVVCKIPLDTYDTGPLKSALAELLVDPRRRAQLSARALEHVRVSHDLDTCVREYVAFLRRCAALEPVLAPPRQGRPLGPLPDRTLDLASLEAAVDERVGDRSVPSRPPLDGARRGAHVLARALSSVPLALPSMKALEIGWGGLALPFLRHLLLYDAYGTTEDPARPEGLSMHRARWGEAPDEEYPVSNGDLESSPLCFADGSMDVVVCGEVLGRLTRDPMHLLAEINRVLTSGGLLTLIAPNVRSPSSDETRPEDEGPTSITFPAFSRAGSTVALEPEYSPGALRALLQSAGFFVVLEPYDASSSCSARAGLGRRSAEDRRSNLPGDHVYVRAVKITRIIDRYPEPFYESGELRLCWSNDVVAVAERTGAEGSQ